MEPVTAVQEHQAPPAKTVHIELAAERLGSLGPIPLTNTLVTSWAVLLVLVILGLVIGSRVKLIPGRLQFIFESLIEYVYDFMSETLESKMWARRFLPLLLTMFLFIAVANLLEFMPGVGSIGLRHGDEFIPLFRSMNTDLNVTLAFSIISVFVIEITGIVAVGFWKYAGKFINFSSPLNFVVGIIELVSELSRFISFSFRLFGNIFAGEVLIAVASFFAPYILPVPLMGFEMFVGFVQAAVFALLTLFFIKLAIADPHGSH